MRPALLVLEDGTTFEGVGFGADSDAFGEVVFNTSMSGYQEVLTDPSYEGQIVTMTYPHIGNYGVNDDDVESHRPWVRGYVIRDLPAEWSSWRGNRSLDDYLRQCGVPGVAEIDTRRLTRHIRDHGAMRGAISTGILDPDALLEQVRASPSIVGADLVRRVSAAEPYQWPVRDPRWRVAAYDFGIKLNILRQLAAHGCAVTVYPATAPAEEVLAGEPDGVFLSNGPGDPEPVTYGIEAIRAMLGRVPIFGICLGHQLLGLAVGLKTYKLAFGHHGINHPVVRLATGAIEITTQNHGFAVRPEAFGLEAPNRPGEPLPSSRVAESLFGGLELTHLNLNDYTIEGLRLADVPAFSVQYHPEAAAGPHDAAYLFDRFCQLMTDRKAS